MRLFVLPLALLVAACQPATTEPAPAPASHEQAPTTPTDAPATDAPQATAPAVKTDALPARALAALRQDVGTDLGEIRVFGRSIDLDGDDREETVAQLVGPMVCGSGGCNTYVLAQADDAWRIVATIRLRHPPVAALPSRSEGWRDLVVAVGGGGGESGFSTLRYNGTAYAGGSGLAPAIPTDAEVLIPRFETMRDGTLLE